ncbi:Derlin 1 [Coelomomyces lativittatus]|nr:Derlin 1 [Coelomomyces lativittatus]
MNATRPPSPLSTNPVVKFILELPKITRFLFLSSLGLPLISRFLTIRLEYFLFIPSKILFQGQVWRLLSCFFVAQLGLDFLLQLYFLYLYSSQLEIQHFQHKTAEYAYFVTFCMVLSWLFGYFFALLVLKDVLLFALIYVWSRCNAHQSVQFMFGITFQALYLPWVLVIFSFLITSQPPLTSLLGIAIGHVYYYLKIEYPTTMMSTHQGRPPRVNAARSNRLSSFTSSLILRLTTTPSFFYTWFPESEASSSHFNVGSGTQHSGSGRSTSFSTRPHTWNSRGQRLGS